MHWHNTYLFLFTVVLGLMVAGCQPASPTATRQPVVGLANPASIHCQQQGGTLEMRQD
jgi:putative hemolysin